MKMKWTVVGVGVAMLSQTGFALADTTTAAPRALPTQYQAQVRDGLRPRVSDRQIQNIVTRIRTDAQALQSSLDNNNNGNVPRGRAYGNRARNGESALSYLVDDLAQAADHLSDHVTRNVTIRADVDDVLQRAAQIDNAVARETLTGMPQTNWNRLRRDVDELASGYGITTNWRTANYAGGYDSRGGVYERLSGTYRLDPARSDDAHRAADRVLGQVPAAQRSRISSQIYALLEAPDVLSIDRQGNRVTIASSRAPQMTFTADGQARSENMSGRNMTTRASMYGDRLEVNANGVNGAEFTATFEPLDNGQSLRVSRTIYDEALRNPVVMQSTYRRTSETPEWNLYNGSAANSSNNSRYDTPNSRYDTPNSRTSGRSTIPNGTQLTATLDQAVNARSSRQNDRVTMTVNNAPRPELEGAVIQGYLVDSPSTSNGRTGLSIAFNEIRLRNGQTMDFDGAVQSIRSPNGQSVVFDADQVNKDEQRDQAIQRGAIGATVGAIIGAVVGGGKGAVAGAVLGGGGAAATVFLPNNQYDLPRGTEFTIRSGSGY